MSESVQVQVNIERIYLKDASFESPGSPTVFSEPFRPEMNVDINTRVNSLGDDRHEVVLSATLKASRGESKMAYVVEVQQAGIFVLSGAEGEQLAPILGVHCPTMLFPYLRESIDALVIKGGFPAVQLAPVNFERLFAEMVRQRNEQEPDQQTH